MSGSRRIVLLVDDEPAALLHLQASLPAHLAGFDVATAGNGREAVAYLEEQPVDVLVTDVNMPVMDGFELLAYTGRHYPNLPVVVLSVMAPEAVTNGLAELGSISVLRKPASPAAVARAVIDARAATARGRLSHVPLSTLLQLMHLERKTCSLFVRSGDRKGRLHFLSGELVNAYSFELDVDGEPAARHLLALDTVTVDFERSLHNHDRRIHLPLEQLLLEVAAARDEAMAEQPGALEGAIDADDDAAPPLDSGDVDREELAPEVVVRDDHLLAPQAPAPSTAADHAGFERAAGGLERAIADLRTRAEDTWSLLDALSPVLTAVSDDTDAVTTAPDLDGRSASEWRQVAALAKALAHKADLLAEPAPSD